MPSSASGAAARTPRKARKRGATEPDLAPKFSQKGLRPDSVGIGSENRRVTSKGVTDTSLASVGL